MQKIKIKKIKNLRFEAWPQETKKQKTEAFILLNLLYVFHYFLYFNKKS